MTTPPGLAAAPPGAPALGTPPAAPALDAPHRTGRRHLPGPVQVAGWSRLSTVDWPDQLVTTLFLQGCPWRCTYCHNPGILEPRAGGTVPWSSVVAHLHARRSVDDGGVLDGVVFSGGEPCLQPGLVDAAVEVRRLGFRVGVHTGGAYPRRLRELVALHAVDWVGLDVKAPERLYPAITGRPGGFRRMRESLRVLLDAGVDVTVRTTVDPTVLTADDVREVTAWLASEGVHEHVLQTVRYEGTRPEYAAALRAAGGPAVVA